MRSDGEVKRARLEGYSSNVSCHDVEGYDPVHRTSVDARVLTNFGYC